VKSVDAASPLRQNATAGNVIRVNMRVDNVGVGPSDETMSLAHYRRVAQKQLTLSCSSV
jgi:hypothetical protein